MARTCTAESSTAEIQSGLEDREDRDMAKKKQKLPRDRELAKARAAGMARATAGKARTFANKKDILGAETGDGEIDEGVEEYASKKNAAAPDGAPAENAEVKIEELVTKSLYDEDQFSRLLAEIRAIGLSDAQFKALSESMDLPRKDIESILFSAEVCFEMQKNRVGLKVHETRRQIVARLIEEEKP
jgi:hypothetical protein